MRIEYRRERRNRGVVGGTEEAYQRRLHFQYRFQDKLLFTNIFKLVNGARDGRAGLTFLD